MKTSCVEKIANFQNHSTHLVRIAIFIVMVWIGGLKFVPYEAEGIVPFVANSPVMSFFYANPAPQYHAHMNKEGEYVEANRAWHFANHTYIFSYALGSLIILIGFLMLGGVIIPEVGLVGAFFTVGMSFVTLSFLITTPEVRVSCFPYLAGPGRLVVKDLIMLAGAVVCMSNSAQAILSNKNRRSLCWNGMSTFKK